MRVNYAPAIANTLTTCTINSVNLHHPSPFSSFALHLKRQTAQKSLEIRHVSVKKSTDCMNDSGEITLSERNQLAQTENVTIMLICLIASSKPILQKLVSRFSQGVFLPRADPNTCTGFYEQSNKFIARWHDEDRNGP